MNTENLEPSTENNDKASERPAAKIVQSTKDWRDNLLEKDLLSPIYIFIFIVLFKDGKDGIDLHDAIVMFISTYNGQ
ncbi:hypothetical protein [Aeromonas veronii]|uniref:hypothetical protein n=1 Tax=Aeromonas veronii TaxID=654 RepID=UPI00191CDA0F|nr:hypothetical protein [Aeromonas veronii]MBL0592639.1 hypothetical protein [Aeromonas veronii]